MVNNKFPVPTLWIFLAFLFAFAHGQGCCPKLILSNDISAAKSCSLKCFEGLVIENFDCAKTITSPQSLELAQVFNQVVSIKGPLALKNVKNCHSVVDFNALQLVEGDLEINDVENLDSMFKNIKSISLPAMPCKSKVTINGLTKSSTVITDLINKAAQKGESECLSRFTTTAVAPAAKSETESGSDSFGSYVPVIIAVGVSIACGILVSIGAFFLVRFLRKGKKNGAPTKRSKEKTKSKEGKTKSVSIEMEGIDPYTGEPLNVKSPQQNQKNKVQKAKKGKGNPPSESTGYTQEGSNQSLGEFLEGKTPTKSPSGKKGTSLSKEPSGNRRGMSKSPANGGENSNEDDGGDENPNVVA